MSIGGCPQSLPLPTSGRGDVRLMPECLPATAHERVEECRDVGTAGDEGSEAFVQEPCVPELAALVTGPDTAPTARPSSAAGGNVQGTGAVTGLFRGDILAVAGGGAGTGDRHAITRRRGEEGDGASQPQHSRARAHIVECSRPLVLAGKRTRSPRRSVSDSACATVRGTMRGAALRRHSPASTASTVFGTPPVTAASRTESTAPNTATSPPVTASSGSTVAARGRPARSVHPRQEK